MLLEAFLCALLTLGAGTVDSSNTDEASTQCAPSDGVEEKGSELPHTENQIGGDESPSMESIFQNIHNGLGNVLETVWNEGLLNHNRAAIFGVVFFACASGGMPPIHTALVILWIIVWAFVF